MYRYEIPTGDVDFYLFARRPRFGCPQLFTPATAFTVTLAVPEPVGGDQAEEYLAGVERFLLLLTQAVGLPRANATATSFTGAPGPAAQRSATAIIGPPSALPQ